MDCAEIRSGFLSGHVPEGPGVSEHMGGCPQCRELFEKGATLGKHLAVAVAPAPDPGDLLATVEADLKQEVGVRARLRAWPTGLRAALLVAIGLLLLGGSQLLVLPRSDFATQGLAFWLVVGFLVAWLAVGSMWLLQGVMAPISTARLGGSMAVVLLLVPAAVAVMGHEAGAPWVGPEFCFGYGGILVGPFIVAAWLLERRDRAPTYAWVGMGALAGITANLLLHVHCPATHLGHLLLGHATIGAAWALGLGLLSRRLQRRD